MIKFIQNILNKYRCWSHGHDYTFDGYAHYHPPKKEGKE